jgi:hypothetical protein
METTIVIESHFINLAHIAFISPLAHSYPHYYTPSIEVISSSGEKKIIPVSTPVSSFIDAKKVAKDYFDTLFKTKGV